MAMKSICAFCGRDITMEPLTGIGGELVEFADFDPLPHGMGGQSWGHEWVCDVHLEDARSLAHWDVRRVAQWFEEHIGPRPKGYFAFPELWIDDLGGATKLEVMKALRAAADLSLGDAKAAVAGIPGCVLDLEPLTREQSESLLETLRELGVAHRVELRLLESDQGSRLD